MLRYEVIVTIDNGPVPQFVIDIDVINNISETSFLDALFDTMAKEEIKNLATFSCCQMNTTNVQDLLPFIRANNGKYYFSDPATNEMRNAYLARK